MVCINELSLKNRKTSKQVINVSMLVWIMITHNINIRVHLWAYTLFHIIFKLRLAQLLWTTRLVIFHILSLLIHVVFFKKSMANELLSWLLCHFLYPGVTDGSRDPKTLEVLLAWWCFRGRISVLILEISTSVITGFAVVTRKILHHVQC